MIRQLTALAVLVLPIVVLSASAAQAKGADSVTITGPGLDGVTLRYTRTSRDIDLDSMSQASRIYDIYNAREAQTASAHPAASDLGPRYTVVYDFFGEPITQHIYPFADRGPEVFFPPGQALPRITIRTGWVTAPAELESMLVALGAAQPEPATPSPSRADDPVTPGLGLAALGDDGLNTRDGWLVGAAAIALLGLVAAHRA